MGSSASIFSARGSTEEDPAHWWVVKQSSSTHNNLTSQKGSSKILNRAEHLNPRVSSREPNACLSRRTTISLLQLHKFAAGQLSEDMELPLVEIESHLEIFRLPPIDSEDYYAVSQQLASTSSEIAHGIPTTLGHATKQMYTGLFPHVTPLMQAVLHSNSKAVEMLINADADVNAKTPCDIPYYRNDLPAIPKGATVLMLALYKLFDINSDDTASEEACTDIAHPGTWVEPVTICEMLLDHDEIDVDEGFTNAACDHVSAVTIGGALIEVLRDQRFHYDEVVLTLLSMIAQRVLRHALSGVLISTKPLLPQPSEKTKHASEKVGNRQMRKRGTASIRSSDVLASIVVGESA